MNTGWAMIGTYLLVVNLWGLIVMGSDKRKAMAQKWRISEKSLFAIALCGGGIGIWSGMYIFRHKTKHKIFTIGIPLIILAQALLLAMITCWI